MRGWLTVALAAALAAALTGCGDDRVCVGARCGLVHHELCDATGDEDGDGTADCADPDCIGHPACQPPCGNGIQNIGESCDDGNPDDGDACTSTCQRARCGDGIVEAGVEPCDDGNPVDSDACTSACRSASSASCRPTTAAPATTSPAPCSRTSACRRSPTRRTRPPPSPDRSGRSRR